MTSIADNSIFKSRKPEKLQMLFVITAVLIVVSSSSVLPRTKPNNVSLACGTRNHMLTNARTLVVPDCFSKIQDAINNASNGDTVLVRANIYYENIVVSKSIFLLGEDKKETIIDGGGGDVVSIVASGAVVSGFTIRNIGFCLGMGIWIRKANNSVICNNIITGNFDGVKIGDRPPEIIGNVVRGNIITKNRYGVFLAHSEQSVVDGNIVSDSGWNGVEIDWGGGNTVCANSISNSTAYGLEIASQTPSDHNIIYHNNFINNTKGSTSSGDENSWDNGYPYGGNFWDDYAGSDLKNGPNQNWLGGDGIGDAPYSVDQSMKDMYPLMGPIFMFNADKSNINYTVSIVSNSTVSNFRYESTGNRLKFQVNGANGTVGFCRICIPHDLMTEPYNLTVDGCSPIFVNYTSSDNGTHRWIYSVYHHSAHEVVIVTEFSTILLLFSTVVITIILMKAFFSKPKKTFGSFHLLCL